MGERFWDQPFDAALFEERALAGDWRAQITVLTRQSVDPDVLAAFLNQPGLHDQVQLVITERRDVTVEELEFLAQRTGSAVVINSIIGHPRTPVELIEAIRDKALTLEGKVWHEVAEYAGRVLAATEQEMRGQPGGGR